MSNQPIPSEVFTDVRKAYRLLHDYQRMVIDAVAFIGNQLTMEYCDFHQLYSTKPSFSSKGFLKKWTWDLLGTIQCEFNFVKELSTDQQLKLSIIHMPDTAALHVDKKTEPNTCDFASAESSLSKICFLFFIEKKETSLWEQHKLTFPNKDQDELKTYLESQKLPHKYHELGIDSLLVDVADICSEQQALTVVSNIKAKLKARHPSLKGAEWLKDSNEQL